MNIIDRITSLRKLMMAKNVDALIIYGTDPHLSEYVPENWRIIEWISDFTGSYGRVVVTMDQALLWTDSRYFIQAETQLLGTEFVMMKDRQKDTISIEQWLKQELNSGSLVAIDGRTISATQADKLKQELSANGIHITITEDLVSQNWKNRPVLPQTRVVDYPVQFAGTNRSDKILQIRNRLKQNHAEATLITQLDDLAWVFNLRGNEIKYNPLFTGYGYIDQDQAIIFANRGSFSPELEGNLNREGVSVIDYESIWKVLLQKLPETVCLDPDRTNSTAYLFFSEKCRVIDGLAIPTLLKSIKNEVEIEGMKAAHQRDSKAMVNFLYWLNKNCEKEKLTELSVAEKLLAFRSNHKYFMDESFSPIVAYGSHGAIVHYSSTETTDTDIVPDGILLIDSGGQYLDGTTDITRTIVIGKATRRQKTDFTLVLKGMIALAKVKFPVGTRGYSLDILARNYLWDKGMNYGHGTGHGVGHYLSVHEGPVGIRPEYLAEPIQKGQILTDEPGLYREGEYGIRIENVLLCKNECSTEFGNFLSFDTLTLCPIDRRLINRKMLDDNELDWLNGYHQRVLRKLRKKVKKEVLTWLIKVCAPL